MPQQRGCGGFVQAFPWQAYLTKKGIVSAYGIGVSGLAYSMDDYLSGSYFPFEIYIPRHLLMIPALLPAVPSQLISLQTPHPINLMSTMHLSLNNETG